MNSAISRVAMPNSDHSKRARKTLLMSVREEDEINQLWVKVSDADMVKLYGPEILISESD